MENKAIKETKTKRKPKGQRTHIRRMKQAERKAAVVVTPKK